MNPMIVDLIEQLVAQGRVWVKSERKAHRPTATPLPVGALGQFLDVDTLNTARLKWVPTISSPAFYDGLRPILATMGATLIDFSEMSGITFVDTILLSQSRPVPFDELVRVVFHELVHVVQYEILGVDQFVEQYVTGWAMSGMTYQGIPLEVMAYDLDARFAAAPAVGFSVRDEVSRRLAV
jgi:hypothetical protein